VNIDHGLSSVSFRRPQRIADGIIVVTVSSRQEFHATRRAEDVVDHPMNANETQV
jgi:hypothetical protein